MSSSYAGVRCLVSFLALATLLLTPTRSFAQGDTASGSLSGWLGPVRWRDPWRDGDGHQPGDQAGPIPGDQRGRFISLRRAGAEPVSVTGELAGFATVKLTDISLNVGSSLDVDLTMTVSTLSESVTVRSEGAIVETAKTDLSTTITQQQIETLPTAAGISWILRS